MNVLGCEDVKELLRNIKRVLESVCAKPNARTGRKGFINTVRQSERRERWVFSLPTHPQYFFMVNSFGIFFPILRENIVLFLTVCHLYENSFPNLIYYLIFSSQTL